MNAALCNDRGIVGTGSGRMTGNSEVIHLDEKRPTFPCAGGATPVFDSEVCRQPVKLDYFRVADDSPGM
jgi:hypothetical protein